MVRIKRRASSSEKRGTILLDLGTSGCTKLSWGMPCIDLVRVLERDAAGFAGLVILR